MNLRYLLQEGEKPLEYIPPNGGFCGIFRTIGCIGDSLSAGEFVSRTPAGEKCYHDFYDHAWGAHLARLCGSTVHIFARGGMTAHAFCEHFAGESGFFDPDKRCQAYIIALGVNDLYNEGLPVGSADEPAPGTFAHSYVRILQMIHTLDARAKIFLMTMPHDHRSEKAPHLGDAHARLLAEITARTPNTYLLDFRTYAPPYDAAFRESFFLDGHMNAAGYLLTAQLAAAYIDYLIRNHTAEFREAGFIGTAQRYE